MNMTRSLGLACALVLASLSGAVAQRTETRESKPEHNGAPVQIDLPPPEQVNGGQRERNFGAEMDGLGQCVWTTTGMLARWGNVPELYDVARKIPYGGGHPRKFDEVMQKHAPHVQYVQYLGTDPSILDLALATGRPCGVTYGYGEFYGGQTIPHMVMLAHLDSQWAAIIDNNDPLVWTWMRRAEFLKRWTHLGGQGWAVVLVVPPPPPVPKN